MKILPGFSNQYIVISLSIIISFLVISCGKTRYSQCEQIIMIANGVAQQTHQLIAVENNQPIETKTWLQAAEIMATAAQQLEALSIRDVQLNNYQADLAKIYRTNSQVTYDMIQAWEDKNVVAAQAAQAKVRTTGELEQKLGNEINLYCFNE